MIMEAMMTIYQVLDEENHLICEYSDKERAIHGAQDMTVWDSDHYYHVQELEIQVV